MSYRPPPTKSQYGDQDFIKEDWTPQPTNQSNPYQARPLSPYQPGYQPGTDQHPIATNNAPGFGAQLPNQPGFNSAQSPNENMSMMLPLPKTITQEDILFLRSWRQDSFFYRVLPLNLLATGAYFYYNKTNGLPHKWSRYVGLGIVCYIVGKASYSGEFKRRIETSPLNTPFMQASRKALGVQQRVSDGFVSDTSTDFTYGNTGAYGAGGFSQPGMPPAAYDPRGTSFGNQNYNNQPGQSMTTDLTNVDENGPKPTTSYEELRARNRGLLVK